MLYYYALFTAKNGEKFSTAIVVKTTTFFLLCGLCILPSVIQYR